MKITYLVKHNIDYSSELVKAKQVADWAVQNKFKTSSKYVKHIGLKSAIANQILKKYGKNRNIKQATNVKLTIPASNGNIQIKDEKIYVCSLNKLYITPYFDLSKIQKICQIEVDNKNYYITCEIKEEPIMSVSSYIGVDINTTEHLMVIASGGKIIKKGRSVGHIKRKYSFIRRKLQKKQQYATLRTLKNKERRVVKDLLNKATAQLVRLAKTTNQGIRIEDLTGIREDLNKTFKGKKLRYSTNNWNYSVIRKMIEYKAKICGVPVEAVNPAYTSKMCSRCGIIGQRNSKKFKCGSCGHVDHADANAAFNISARNPADTAFISMIAGTSKAPCIKGVCSPEAATGMDGISDRKLVCL